MKKTTKLFLNGRSQAVRIPLEFRFDCKEVYIRKDPVNDDLIISKKPEGWDDYFSLLNTLEIPDDFMSDRDQEPPTEKALF